MLPPEDGTKGRSIYELVVREQKGFLNLYPKKLPLPVGDWAPDGQTENISKYNNLSTGFLRDFIP